MHNSNLFLSFRCKSAYDNREAWVSDPVLFVQLTNLSMLIGQLFLVLEVHTTLYWLYKSHIADFGISLPNAVYTLLIYSLFLCTDSIYLCSWTGKREEKHGVVWGLPCHSTCLFHLQNFMCYGHL